MEGYRYWDLIRWKTAEINLPKPILGNYFFAAEFGSQVKPLLTADNYIVAQETRFRNLKPERDYLRPFPTNQLALNPALKQNPVEVKNYETNRKVVTELWVKLREIEYDGRSR